jgi:hypothetical protein
VPSYLKSSMKLAIVVRAGSRVSVRGAVGWCCPETPRRGASCSLRREDAGGAGKRAH